MIISVSRRTDVPAFYSEWFFRRIREGEVWVPNPYRPNKISRVRLDPSVVDCFVFWSKNPEPMLGRLNRLKDYPFYFQFTLNPYETDIELHLPELRKRIDTFKRLSDRIGKERVIWRYDPIFVSDRYDERFHQERFSEMAEKLSGYTEKCMLGFIDHYPHIRVFMERSGISSLKENGVVRMAVSFKQTVEDKGIELNTCTNKIDLTRWGIPVGKCVDDRLIEKIAGYPVAIRKDRNQRSVCRCVESIDIGMYGSCLHGCGYCYATRGKEETVKKRSQQHDPDSPMLVGRPCSGDIVTEREMRSLRSDSFLLF